MKRFPVQGVLLFASLLCACVAMPSVVADDVMKKPAAVPEPPEPTAEAALLELPGDGFLQGKLAASGPADGQPRATLHWQSPLFTQPIEFRLDGIRRIRLAKQPAPAPGADSWRVDLQGGDIVIGELDAIDADHVVLRAAGFGAGPLRIRRAAVVRLARPTAAVKVIVPGDVAGWEGPRGATEGQAGRIVCARAAGMVTRDVAAPPRAFFDIAVSWDERPEFEIHCVTQGKADDKPGSSEESYRIEAVAKEAIAIREGATAAFDPIGSLADAAGSLRLRVFVDQQRGRLAVVSAEDPAGGKVLFDGTVAPRKPPGVGRFGIRVHKGSLRIDSLRVGAWTTEEPQLPKAADVGGPDAIVEAFDRARGSFTVRSDGAVREVPLAEVTAIEFAGQPAAEQPAAGLACAAFHGGSRLTGKIIEVTASGLRLDCPALADPLECSLAQLSVLEPRAASAGEVAGRQGLFEATGGRMLGSLAGLPGGKGGVGWQPRGAVAPVAVDPTKAMKIRYRGIAGVGKEKDAEKAAAKPAGGQATVYLKTGDSIQCTVLSAGPEGARIRTDLEADLLVPTAAMRAAELLPAAAASIPKDKFARLLTLPRMQQADPPTHMLRLTSGDYLRGKLVSLDENMVRLEVLGTVKEIPRSQAARLIWLTVVGDDSQQKAAAVIMGGGEPGTVPVRAVTTDGRRLSFAADRIDGERVIGRNGAFGTASVDLARCDHLDLGRAAAEAAPGTIPYAQWQLKPATQPRALTEQKP